ncbi:MAG: hypothetical protein M1812_005576 [Candelaria pacifica]|nr:MAG: hypothetical protein M1812_005576 [Candelaria pacifica]
MSGQPPPFANFGPPFYGPPFPGGSGRAVIILPPEGHPPMLELQPGDVAPIFYDPSTGAIWDPVALPSQDPPLVPLGFSPPDPNVFPYPPFYITHLPIPLQVAPGYPIPIPVPIPIPSFSGQQPWTAPDVPAQDHGTPVLDPPHNGAPTQAPTRTSPPARSSPRRRSRPTRWSPTATTQRGNRDPPQQRHSQRSHGYVECVFDPAHRATEVFRGAHYCNNCLEVVRVSLLRR